MDMALIQTALRTWVATSTGLPSASVILADQDGPRPAKPFATVKVTAIESLGAYDGVSVSMTGGTPAAGAEVTLTAGGHRELTVSVQVYTADLTAMALASKLAAGASLMDATFDLAGAALCDVRPARNLSDVFRTQHEGRAQVDASVYATESVSTTTTYIETAIVNRGDPDEFTAPEA